jgi:hypothetical protein
MDDTRPAHRANGMERMARKDFFPLRMLGLMVVVAVVVVGAAIGLAIESRRHAPPKPIMDHAPTSTAALELAMPGPGTPRTPVPATPPAPATGPSTPAAAESMTASVPAPESGASSAPEGSSTPEPGLAGGLSPAAAAAPWAPPAGASRAYARGEPGASPGRQASSSGRRATTPADTSAQATPAPASGGALTVTGGRARQEPADTARAPAAASPGGGTEGPKLLGTPVPGGAGMPDSTSH